MNLKAFEFFFMGLTFKNHPESRTFLVHGPIYKQLPNRGIPVNLIRILLIQDRIQMGEVKDKISYHLALEVFMGSVLKVKLIQLD